MLIRSLHPSVVKYIRQFASTSTVQKISARLVFMVRVRDAAPFRAYNIVLNNINFYTIENEITPDLQSYYDYLPAPAILSVDVDPAPDGIYGMMARATVNVRCFSLKQLRELEWSLFPGITALIEVVRTNNEIPVDFISDRYVRNPSLLKDILFSPQSVIKLHEIDEGNRIFFPGILKRTNVSYNNNTFDITFEFSNFSIASVFFSRNYDIKDVETARKTLAGFYNERWSTLSSQKKVRSGQDLNLDRTYQMFGGGNKAFPAEKGIEVGVGTHFDTGDKTFAPSLPSNIFESLEYIRFEDFLKEILIPYIRDTYPEDVPPEMAILPIDIDNSYMFIHKHLRTNNVDIIFPTEYMVFDSTNMTPDYIMGFSDYEDHAEWFEKNFGKPYTRHQIGSVGKVGKVMLARKYLSELIGEFERGDDKPFSFIIDRIIQDIIKSTYGFSQLFLMKVGEQYVIYDNRLLDVETPVQQVENKSRLEPEEIKIWELHDISYTLDIPEYLAMAVMMKRLSASLNTYVIDPVDFLIPGSVEDVVLKTLTGERVKGTALEDTTESSDVVVTKVNLSAEVIRALMNNPNFRALMNVIKENESGGNYEAIEIEHIIAKHGSYGNAFALARLANTRFARGKVWYRVRGDQKEEITGELVRKVEQASSFRDLVTHPFVDVPKSQVSLPVSPGRYTTACGAYQFTETTWRWIEREYADLWRELSKKADVAVDSAGNEMVVTGLPPATVYEYQVVVDTTIQSRLVVPPTPVNQDYMVAIYLTIILNNANLTEEEWNLFLNEGFGFKREEIVKEKLTTHFASLRKVNLNASIRRDAFERKGNVSTFLSIKHKDLSETKSVKSITFDVTKVDDRYVAYIPMHLSTYYEVLLYMGTLPERQRGRGAQYLTGITLNITVPGNSLWRVFDTFKIEGIPEIYYENGYFIVTKISHNISGGTWTTGVTAKYFYTGKT